MSTETRYEVHEFPGGWRVIENTANGQKIHQRQYRTEAGAAERAAMLTAQSLRITAAAGVRQRAKKRCECRGECDQGHRGRCSSREGELHRIPGGAKVILNVVAVNHNNDDLRPENLRAYCQLCKAYHDAEAVGIEPLFVIGGTDA
jgi:hypothetical protein